MASGFVQVIAARIAEHGGVAVFIDYGEQKSLGDTFQAVQNHKPVSPLSEPGQADLTAHVDFGALIAEAGAVQTTNLTHQSDLLDRLGIATRSEKLAQNLEGDELEMHRDAHRRLTDPREMGTLFKAIALYQNGAKPPPGFET